MKETRDMKLHTQFMGLVVKMFSENSGEEVLENKALSEVELLRRAIEQGGALNRLC